VARLGIEKKRWLFSLWGFPYIDIYIYVYWLVVLTILKNMKVNGKDYPIYYRKKKCSKPPTRMDINGGSPIAG
jgi:hypothetical protein